MIISSRTPEGWPAQCPMCDQSLRLEPSLPSCDATCLHCGCLVWLARPASGAKWWSWIRRPTVIVTAVAVVWIIWLAARFGTAESVVLAVIAVILFGRRLPDLARLR
jgi:hypothetical protein